MQNGTIESSSPPPAPPNAPAPAPTDTISSSLSGKSPKKVTDSLSAGVIAGQQCMSAGFGWQLGTCIPSQMSSADDHMPFCLRPLQLSASPFTVHICSEMGSLLFCPIICHNSKPWLFFTEPDVFSNLRRSAHLKR